MNFQIEAPYGPAGDQPAAIAGLLGRIRQGEKHNVLLGVTGSCLRYLPSPSLK